MKCEYKLCIYYDNDACILNDIEIDGTGMCDSCIVVNIQEEYLSQMRQAALSRFKEIHNAWETETAEDALELTL